MQFQVDQQNNCMISMYRIVYHSLKCHIDSTTDPVLIYLWCDYCYYMCGTALAWHPVAMQTQIVSHIDATTCDDTIME